MNCLFLAAGYGTRLGQLSQHWPKCLMPIKQRPLLEYWLSEAFKLNFDNIYVNTHYLRSRVSEFLHRPRFEQKVSELYEPNLLGTAATIRTNYRKLKGKPLMLIHADNWCQCNLSEFIRYHKHQRPKQTVMSMMTFTSDTPKSCGIVELDKDNIVEAFHEKVQNPPGNKANAAVYILEPELLERIADDEAIVDFSTQVLPSMIGKIATWHNDYIHRDIGTPKMLKLAQGDPTPELYWEGSDNWQQQFLTHSIQRQVANIDVAKHSNSEK